MKYDLEPPVLPRVCPKCGGHYGDQSPFIRTRYVAAVPAVKGGLFRKARPAVDEYMEAHCLDCGYDIKLPPMDRDALPRGPRETETTK